MDFQIGETVVHCAYGLGQVLALEERALDQNTTLYYMVRMADLTVWVPDDEKLKSRLRVPTDEASFRKLLSILSSPVEPLPEDRHQRNVLIMGLLNDGKIESLLKAMRDLTAFRQSRFWNEYDNGLMKRAQKALIGEWSLVLSITPSEAEYELHGLLTHKQD